MCGIHSCGSLATTLWVLNVVFNHVSLPAADNFVANWDLFDKLAGPVFKFGFHALLECCQGSSKKTCQWFVPSWRFCGIILVAGLSRTAKGHFAMFVKIGVGPHLRHGACDAPRLEAVKKEEAKITRFAVVIAQR